MDKTTRLYRIFYGILPEQTIHELAHFLDDYAEEIVERTLNSAETTPGGTKIRGIFGEIIDNNIEIDGLNPDGSDIATGGSYLPPRK